MEKPTLVILAAGMGSRYGGLKQIDPVDPYGNMIFDFSIYFFKGLVDGDSSHGDRSVPDNPLTGFVYVVTGR